MAREVSSRVLDGINDLVIMAPIREGFIDAYESVTFATRLRIISEVLNDIRATSREFENDAPFADASERILSLLDFRVGIIDNELLQINAGLNLTARRYLYLVATFDGVWEPYMRLIWSPLGTLLDLLFVNCEGYVFAKDNSFEDYITWVRSAQVDSSVFFTTTGVTVSDQIYLRKLEVLQRELPPSCADLKIAQYAVSNPADEAAAVRARDPVIANRLALEALGVFYRLADYYPPLPDGVLGQLGHGAVAEGYLLQRAMHEILKGWDYLSLKQLLDAPPDRLSDEQQAQRISLERFRNLIDWFASGATASGETAFPSRKKPVEDQRLNPSEVQRGILKPIGGLGARPRHGRIVLMTIGNPAEAPKFVTALLDKKMISFESDTQELASTICCTLGVTANGLERLAVKRAVVDALPKEFREGLHKRASSLGDVWTNHPRNWRLPARNWPPLKQDEKPRPPVEIEEIDMVIILRDALPEGKGSDAALREKLKELIDLAEAHAVHTVSIEELENHYDQHGKFRDHFGLRDGISQPKPKFDAELDLAQRLREKRDDVRVGEVLCGYSNDRGDQAPAQEEVMLGTTPNDRLDLGKRSRSSARELQRNGSYLVLRKMRQDVAAFEAYKQANSDKLDGDADALVSKLLGRHPDGSSLIDPNAKDYNDFDYSSDPKGSACPFASHIRRANPRRIEHGRPSPRILRCGMSYGPRYQRGESPDAAASRGLMFMAYNSSIAEQYETIQRWLNGGNSTGVASANNDPLTGTPPRPDGKRTYRFEAGGQVVRTEIPKPFVELEWGLYLLVPSLSALHELGKGGTYYEDDEPYENAGKRFVDRLNRLPEYVAAAEWKRIIEDFDAKDISQRDLTPDIYSGIRFWRDGVERVPGGIGKSTDRGNLKSEASKPAVIVASRKRIMDVLSDWKRFSVEEGLSRLVRTSGSIYVAQQPDNIYDDKCLAKESNYKFESEGTNAIIDAYDEADGFEDGYQAGKAVLGWLIADAERRHAILVGAGQAETQEPEFKLELRREYIAPALARCNRAWFGLPDGNFKEDGEQDVPARFMEPGDWSWEPAEGRLPTCPGDCLSPSRHAFYPNSNPVSEALALNHGEAIRKAGLKFAEHYFKLGKEKVPGRISKKMFALKGMTPKLAGRNVIGIMLGATPPTMGNLQGIFYDWLNQQTLWRHQAALLRVTGGKPADYQSAKTALRDAMWVSMCKRPSPELLFRTCRGDKNGSPVVIERKLRQAVDDRNPPTDTVQIQKGDLVYLPLASATQWAIRRGAQDPTKLEEGVNVIFGGKRGEPSKPDGLEPPVHACPGRKLATGAMLGIIAAFLEVGRIQAQSAGLIVKISNWKS